MTDTTSRDEQRLAEALRREADRLVVGDHGLAEIRARLATGGPVGSSPVTAGTSPPRSSRLRRGVLTGAAAVGLAAAVSLAVSIGLRPDSTPQPVETPALPPVVATTYDTSPGRSTVDIYRVRSSPSPERPRLARETVGVTQPYEPRQALDALFGLPALNRADDSQLDDGLNVVAGTAETADALVLDMAEVDELSSPVSRAVAEVWVQAWVRTLQSAYDSDKPVLITVGGRPTTLYGLVDTSRPIAAADTPVVRDEAIFVPRPDQPVTSPVSFAADLPAGAFTWRVTGADGRQVGAEREIEGDGGDSGPVVELPAGRYRVTVTSGPDSTTADFRRSVAFEVTGPAATTGPPPVTEPPTTPLDTVDVFYPSSEGPGFLRERRIRRDPVLVLADHLVLPPTGSASSAAGLGADDRIGSVTVQPDRVVVDFAVLGPAAPGTRPALLRRQAAAFVETVQSVTGRDLPVLVTRQGAPASLFGQTSLAGLSIAAREVTEEDVIHPQVARDPGRAEVVGSLAEGVTATYTLDDVVTRRTSVQGTVPVTDPASGDYAFSVPIPAGRYLLTVQGTDAGGEDLTEVVEVTVS